MNDETLMKLLEILLKKDIMPGPVGADRADGTEEIDPVKWINRTYDEVTGIADQQRKIDKMIHTLACFGYTVTNNED